MRPQLALGMRTPGAAHLTARALYPGAGGAEAGWDPAAGALSVTLPRAPSACVIRLG